MPHKRPDPGLGTIVAEGLWIALAILALWMRHESPAEVHGLWTLVALFNCVIAFAVAIKDSIVGAKWVRRLNAAAVILPFLLLASFGLLL